MLLAILATMEVIALAGDIPAQAGDATEVADKTDQHEARVTVNGQFVVLTTRKVTGLQIKEAAIAAGVPIQLDFVLSEVRPSGEQKIIPDDREITVKFPQGEMKFSGRDFLVGFSLPNFFFHVTTAYALLRHKGSNIGKMDFLGGQ